MAIRRHIHVSPYHYCGICGSRSDLRTMVRQRGILVDTTHSGCYDNGIGMGDRDAAIARALSKETRELQPDKKLTDIPQTDEDVSFAI